MYFFVKILDLYHCTKFTVIFFFLIAWITAIIESREGGWLMIIISAWLKEILNFRFIDYVKILIQDYWDKW